LNVDREVNQVKGIIYPRKGEEKMACKKQIVKVYPDKTKTYSCGNCAELPTCKKEEGKTARCMREVMRDFKL